MNKKSVEKKEGFWKHNYKIIKHNKKFLFLLFAGLAAIYSFLYGLWKIPFIGFGIYRDSLVGAGDYLFIFGSSALISLFVLLWRHERKNHIQSNAAVGVTSGGIAAFAAGICPACQGIALVALGTTFLNIPTTNLIPYLGIIKIVSLGALSLAVYLKADSVYTKTCKACLIFPESKKNKRKKTRNFHSFVKRNLPKERIK